MWFVIVVSIGLERGKESGSAFAIMDPPVMIPEILTTPAGPFFIVQYVRNKNLLSAIHSYSDTLSVDVFLIYDTNNLKYININSFVSRRFTAWTSA